MPHASHLELRYESHVESISWTIQSLLDVGWKVVSDEEISYLPLHKNDWHKVREDHLNQVMNEIKQKESDGEPIGIVMTFDDTGRGGSFRFERDGQLTIHLYLRRKYLSEFMSFSDVTWYLNRLLPAFSTSEQVLESFTWREET